MENTSCGANCAFVKSGFCSSDKECPHFVQTLWQIEGDQMPKIVSDCYPKKFSLEQNKLLHRFLCMQSVQEELRHKIGNLESAIKQLCSVLSQNFNEKQNQNILLNNESDIKNLE